MELVLRVFSSGGHRPRFLLSGRVRRHRDEKWTKTDVLAVLFSISWRDLQTGNGGGLQKIRRRYQVAEAIKKL